MMLNSDGFWLLAPNPDDAWSFMFDGAWSFPAAHPQVWDHIQNQAGGQLENVSGLYLFETVWPMADMAQKVSGLKMASGQEKFKWILVAYSSSETMAAMRKILILERLPWLVLPVVLLLQSGIAFLRRRPFNSGDDNGSVQ